MEGEEGRGCGMRGWRVRGEGVWGEGVEDKEVWEWVRRRR